MQTGTESAELIACATLSGTKQKSEMFRFAQHDKEPGNQIFILSEAKNLTSFFRAAQAKGQGPMRRKTHLLMQTMRNQPPGTLEKLSIFLPEGIQFVTFGMYHSDDAAMVVGHRHNDL